MDRADTIDRLCAFSGSIARFEAQVPFAAGHVQSNRADAAPVDEFADTRGPQSLVLPVEPRRRQRKGGLERVEWGFAVS